MPVKQKGLVLSVPRHTLYNLAGSVVPILVSLATVPLYLSHVGLDRYGILALCWLILGYFNVFDFGLGRAASQKIASLADADGAERSRIFWTALSLTLGMGLIAMVVFAPVCKIALDMIKVTTPALRREFDDSLVFLVLCLPLGLMNSLFNGVLMGRRQFLKSNLVNTVGSVATAVFPLTTAIVFGPSLPFLIGSALLARLFSTSMLLLVCLRAVPILRPTRPETRELRALMSFGSWATVSNLVGPILAFSDRLLIGAVLNSAAVAIYVIAFSLVWQVSILPTSLTSAMYPLLASSSPAERARLTERALDTLSLAMTPAVLFGLMIAGPFLHIWLGATKGDAAAPITYLLLFGLWANSFALVPAAHLEAQGRPRVLAKLHLVEVVPYLVLLYLSVRWIGIEGAAFTWSLRCLVDTVALFRLANDRLPKSVYVEGVIVAAAIAVVLVFPLLSVARWLISPLLLALGTAWVVSRHLPLLMGYIASLRRQTGFGLGGATR